MRKNESPSIIFPQSTRNQSIERPQDSTEDLQLDFEALKRSYQRLVEENMTLKSEKSLCFGESFSTMGFEKENDQILQNLAGEVEELYGTLSDSHVSIQELLDSCGETHEECLELKRQLNHLKFTQELQEYTKSVKINLVKFM